MINMVIAAFISLGALLGLILLRAHLRTPARRYEGADSVAEVYDLWTNDPRMEYYWGEHLHAGYYGNPPVKKDLIQAKVDFVDAMLDWGVLGPNPALAGRLDNPGADPDQGPVLMLDVGCGIGGSVRHAAKRWPDTSFAVGITISSQQVKRAKQLTKAQEAKNAIVMGCDALNMSFEDNTFDIIWAIESEMHMPDKNQFIQEATRVLKPGGMLVLACWNVRDTRDKPLSKEEAAHIRLLVDEWRHAEFTSIPDYIDIFKRNELINVTAENWAPHTQPSWRESVFKPFRDPRGLITFDPSVAWTRVRDAYTVLRYDEAFRTGLCEYGLIRGQKSYN
jgi:MPBQ/MSBQ methyltransferase